MATLPTNTPIVQIPSGLSPFQDKLYRHLIAWKWEHITRDPGVYAGHTYDAMLPKSFKETLCWPHLYPAIVEKLREHRKLNEFRLHNHFYHMASSQAANLNLFLPVLQHPEAATVLRAVKPDFAELATKELDGGFCVEFWGKGIDPRGKGLLNDRAGTGTDADIAIAYRNHTGELCLWLVEHKLTEREFTACGGAKSKGRKQGGYSCDHTFATLAANNSLCYYDAGCAYDYWKLTTVNQALFVGHAAHANCPFKGGLNQLWRNLLLARALETQDHYEHVTFSVVRHPDNHALDGSLKAFQELIGGHPSFATFTSREVVAAAEQLGDPELNAWAQWYRELYAI